MPVSESVRVARELFEAHRTGDVDALLALTHDEVALAPSSFPPGRGKQHVRDNAGDRDVEAVAHSFEALSAEHVLVGGRLRVFRGGLRDSPAWWLFRIRDGLWVSGETFPSEAAARAAAPPVAA